MLDASGARVFLDDTATTALADKVLDALDEDDDVQNVYSNEDIADDVMERLSA